MTINILVLSDIHGNYPALQAIGAAVRGLEIHYVCNCGDSTVYAPFPNETLAWLRNHQALSISGNTDDKIVRLLKGKSFKKPSKPDKRCMYTSTFEQLDQDAKHDLLALRKQATIKLAGWCIGLFHGSPEDHEEFLFSNTPEQRFMELAKNCREHIVLTGHSHSPYYKQIGQSKGSVHFINPGSVGRMFDGDPRASYAILELKTPGPKALQGLGVQHFRVAYDIERVVTELERQNLPAIYSNMYRQGKKLN
jgi:putative phosphoesterase